MEVLPTFPEEPHCPKICNDTGAFKKSEKNPEAVAEKIKSLKEDREDAEKEAKAAKEAAALSPPIEEPTSSTLADGKTSGDFEYLPGLKPGPDGKVNWTPLAEWTGTRPTVNKYALSRYSLDEWRAHNEMVLDPTVIINSNIVDYNAKTAMMQAFGGIDKQQKENEKRLKQRARDIFRWKTEVERAAKSITAEVETLELERQRLKRACRTLMLPEAISKECLDLRSNRAIPDLVVDLAEIELVKEINIVKEVKETFTEALKKIEDQLAIDKAAKHRIEYDWCDKTLAYNCESINLGLTPKSNTILFRPGATRFRDFSAPLEYWEYFCRENVTNVEAARQKSVDLRGSLNAILDKGGRMLRMQADKTDIALAETVAITQELLTKYEKTLLDTLQRIVDLERLIDELYNSIRKMDTAMKLAQTRLDNRNNWRPHGESVRDQPHLGLIAEVKKIHETVTALRGQLNTAMSVRNDMMKKRILLEKDIAAKRKSLNIDRNRCGMIRSHFPSASELAGY